MMRRSPISSSWLLLVTGAALVASACTLIDLPDPTDGAGAGGLADECTVDEDCLETGTECIVRSCDEGLCTYGPATPFLPIESQYVGDCLQTVCDDMGNQLSVNSDDPYDDGKECTADSCTNGVALNESNPDAPCSNGFCDAQGNCVECNQATHCASNVDKTVCQSGVCVPQACVNGVFDPVEGETDVDCGGPCAPCADGEGCLLPEDCLSGVCIPDAMECAVPSCTDDVLNGEESGVDCGGSCVGCPAGANCNVPGDCESVVCIAGGCEAPTCSDGAANGMESDVDCGGSVCSPCAAGHSCVEAKDCASSVCRSTICQAPTCNDKIKNGTEKGVDCGGSDCPPCQQEVPMEPVP
ncbi:MAG: hypothetical protein RIF41_28280 [Polyangiaceae bacterium]